MKMIVAVDQRWGIGNRGNLLVSIPQDKKQFRSLTMGGVVVGGRKTMEGLPGGTTLKGRTNVILTRRQDYSYSDALVVHSVEETLERLKDYPEDSIYIIGGGQIYREFLPYCHQIYVTRIDYVYEADTFFPNLDEDLEWEMTQISQEQTYYDLEYYFAIYERKKSEP
jgi:dihydrofolate reductase